MAQHVGCSKYADWAFNGKCHRKEAVTHKPLLFLCFVHGHTHTAGVLTYTVLVRCIAA